MSVRKLLGPLCFAALLCGAALGGLAAAALSLVSEIRALTDPTFAPWSSGGSWLGSTFVYSVIGALIGLGAGLVSFLGAAAALLLRERAQRGQPTRSIGGLAGLGAGISTATAAGLLLPLLGPAQAVFLTGAGLVLLSSMLAAALSHFVSRRVTDGAWPAG